MPHQTFSNGSIKALNGKINIAECISTQHFKKKKCRNRLRSDPEKNKCPLMERGNVNTAYKLQRDFAFFLLNTLGIDRSISLSAGKWIY